MCVYAALAFYDLQLTPSLQAVSLEILKCEFSLFILARWTVWEEEETRTQMLVWYWVLSGRYLVAGGRRAARMGWIRS